MGAEQSTGPKVYSKVLEGTATDTHGEIRRSVYSPDKFIEKYDDSVNTLYDNFQHGVKLGGSSPCMGWRPINKKGEAQDFQWLSYDQCWERSKNFGSGIMHKSLVNPNDENLNLVALFSKNRTEWVLAEQACNAYSLVPVALYDTLGPDACKYILNQTHIETIICGAPEAKRIINNVKSETPDLKYLICMDTQLEDGDAEKAKELGLEIFTFTEIEQVGSENPVDVRPPKAEDVATFCYTSGTTGDPKGVMLTHGNLISEVASVLKVGVEINPGDYHLSYLPLAHMFERIVQATLFGRGAACGFYQGNTLKLVEDIKALRPTIFPSVPRLYNKIYDKIMAGVQEKGAISRFLFNSALSTKTENLKTGELRHGLWDGLVFKGVKARLGLDRCKYMITGSAPIARHVMEFLHAVFGVPVFEGYGQTETAAASTLTFIDDFESGHVGGPLPCCEVRLDDVPDMGYTHNDTVHGQDDGFPGIPCRGRGEIVYRGPNMFKGYYKMPEKTAETIDEEGWVHSGDIGLWTPEGALKIIDRKKHIFKLSQGEYVAPEKIENVYTRSTLVAQIFVYGDSLQSALVGIVVPDEDATKKWASHNHVSGDFAAICGNEKFKKALEEDMKKVAKEGKLHGFEQVRATHIESELWSVENEMLTPTFKMKRPEAKKKYKGIIDQMYSAGNFAVAGKTGVEQGKH